MTEETSKEEELKKRKLDSSDTSVKNEAQWISKGYSAAPKIRPKEKTE